MQQCLALAVILSDYKTDQIKRKGHIDSYTTKIASAYAQTDNLQL
jgi:hypothetical protein